MTEKKIKKVTVGVDDGILVIEFPITPEEGKYLEQLVQESPLAEKGLLNKPWESGQLGFIMDTEYVEFSKAAVESIKKLKKSGDAIGEVMVSKYETKDEKGETVTRNSFGWLGGPSRAIKLKDTDLSRNCTPEILVAAEVDPPLSRNYLEYKKTKEKEEAEKQ